jgi:hypothetical protein
MKQVTDILAFKPFEESDPTGPCTLDVQSLQETMGANSLAASKPRPSRRGRVGGRWRQPPSRWAQRQGRAADFGRRATSRVCEFRFVSYFPGGAMQPPPGSALDDFRRIRCGAEPAAFACHRNWAKCGSGWLSLPLWAQTGSPRLACSSSRKGGAIPVPVRVRLAPSSGAPGLWDRQTFQPAHRRTGVLLLIVEVLEDRRSRSPMP